MLLTRATAPATVGSRDASSTASLASASSMLTSSSTQQQQQQLLPEVVRVRTMRPFRFSCTPQPVTETKPLSRLHVGGLELARVLTGGGRHTASC